MECIGKMGDAGINLLGKLHERIREQKADREAVYLRYFTEPGMEKYVKRIS